MMSNLREMPSIIGVVGNRVPIHPFRSFPDFLFIRVNTVRF